MKNYLILLLITISYSSFSQNTKEVEYKEMKRILFFYDLYSDAEVLTKYVTLPEDEHEIIAASINFANTNEVKQENFRVEKDTFLFVSYDSLSKKIFEKGYVFASDESLGTDTVLLANPITFETNFLVRNYVKPYRHGFWTINNNDIQLKGHYLNNKKTGIWQFENFKKEDFRLQMYENDVLMREIQLNLAKSRDIDSTQKWLLGSWDITENVIYSTGDFMGYEKNKRQTEGHRSDAWLNILKHKDCEVLEFCPNSVFKVKNKHFDSKLRKASFSEIKTGTWTITADFLIEIKIEGSKKVIYKPLFMKDDAFRLEKIVVD